MEVLFMKQTVLFVIVCSRTVNSAVCNFAIDYGYNNPTPKAGSEEEDQRWFRRRNFVANYNNYGDYYFLIPGIECGKRKN